MQQSATVGTNYVGATLKHQLFQAPLLLGAALVQCAPAPLMQTPDVTAGAIRCIHFPCPRDIQPVLLFSKSGCTMDKKSWRKMAQYSEQCKTEGVFYAL